MTTLFLNVNHQVREDFYKQPNQSIKVQQIAENITSGEFYGAEFEGDYYRCEGMIES